MGAQKRGSRQALSGKVGSLAAGEEKNAVLSRQGISGSDSWGEEAGAVWGADGT